MNSGNQSQIKEERKVALLLALEETYKSGIFRRDIVRLNEDKLSLMLDDYFLRLNEWKKKIDPNNPYGITLDRHKVGALTAITLSKNPILETSDKTMNGFESIPNEYLGIKLAIARILQDHRSKQRYMTFNDREIGGILRGIIRREYSASQLALTLYFYEAKLVADIEKELNP
ncbi:MAG: hypothetical protein O9264_08840 [Leptospira sp.]|nr:hypothetical protein [Leptospira sp.]